MGELRSGRSEFVLYTVSKDNGMRHFLFLWLWKSANSDCHFAYSGFNFPIAVHTPLDNSIWAYSAVVLIVILVLLLVGLFRKMLRQQRFISAYRHRSADQLRFIRSLLDLCYTYAESPGVFIDKFKDKVNIRELKSYDLIDTSDNRFPNLKEDERLLCMLWEHGFSQRELCVIFNLKKVSNLYTKYHRIQKKLKNKRSETERNS